MSLNIYNDMNLISLVDSMIDKINICWNDPFNPPTVIFPDPLMTNWFKQYWIKHKPVLMNLKFKNLDAFLFKTLNNDRKTKNLTSDILKLKLIDFLNCHSCSGDYNYKKLGGEVIQYLGETEPEPNRMYDFATTVSSLFLKYEISRPEWFLKDEFPDSWQKNLYFDVLNLGIILNECRYATVPELYYAIKKEKREVCDLLSASSSPVFLFGFSAMGQVYRSIIEDLSKNCEIHIFVQAGSNNELAKYGLTHLVAWNRKISTVTDIEPDYELFSAPNKTREVESIHSAICKTLLDKKASKGLMLSDIKVVAPNIGDYLTEINLVFGEPMISDEDVEHKTTKHIPYSILDFTLKLT